MSRFIKILRKNNYVILVTFLLSMIALSLIFLVGCKPAKINDEFSPPKNVRVEGVTLLWRAVNGAKSYEIKIGEKSIVTDKTKYVLADYCNGGDIKLDIAVKALADGKETEYAKTTFELKETQGLDIREETCWTIWDTEMEKYYYVAGVGTANNNKMIMIPKLYNGKPVARIGANAFKSCDKLQTLIIPGGIEFGIVYNKDGKPSTKAEEGSKSYTKSNDSSHVNTDAFSECKSLKNLVIPKAYEQNVLFRTGEVDNSDNIPDSATSKQEETKLQDGEFGILYKWSTVPNSLKQIVITGGEKIPCNSFAYGYMSVEEIYLPSQLKAIETDAFIGCNNLKSIDFKNLGSEKESSIERIGGRAFKDCQKLEQIVFPANLSSIGEFAFVNCKKIESININKSLNKIGKGVFAGCDKLEKLSVENGNENFVIKGNAIVRIKDSTENLSGNEQKKYYKDSLVVGTNTSTIDGSVKMLEDYCFAGLSKLVKFVVPDNVERIGEGVFGGCEGLYDLTLPRLFDEDESEQSESVQSAYSYTLPSKILAYIFGNEIFGKKSECVKIYEIYHKVFVIPNSLRKVTLTSATEIAKCAFQGMRYLSELNLPNSVQQIGEWALEGCERLQSFIIPNDLETIHETAFDNTIVLKEFITTPGAKNYFADSGILYSADKSEIKFVPIEVTGNGDAYISILSSVKEIPKGAFNGRKNLKRINLPSSLEIINDKAFYNCGNLEFIEMSNNVVSIGEEAFFGCKQLNNFNVSSALRKIEKQAFVACESLTKIAFSDALESIGDEAFKHCVKLKEVSIKESLFGEGKIGNRAFSKTQYAKDMGWE